MLNGVSGLVAQRVQGRDSARGWHGSGKEKYGDDERAMKKRTDVILDGVVCDISHSEFAQASRGTFNQRPKCP